MVIGSIKANLDAESSAPMSSIKHSSSSVVDRKQNGISKHDNRDDDEQKSSMIKDEHVLVNLAMADLMAYLQVVANNSNNLPLTRRDDPELTRMVTNLSSEEYARKSAAFIPADVRVIAGSFLKYGNVWDLPTSEEYVASDGAQEPGESFICIDSFYRRVCVLDVLIGRKQTTQVSTYPFLYRSIVWWSMQ